MKDIINEIISENDEFNFEKEFKIEKFKEIAKKYNYIWDGLENQLCLFKKYLERGINILIEGPTGTSKSFTSEVISEYLGYELISMNLSSDTKIGDLMGKLIGNSEEFSGISFKEGPFLEAFTKGKCLKIDEINLASENVLQCIEQSLDSGFISNELNGKQLSDEILKMNENFRLIATKTQKMKNHTIIKEKNIVKIFYLDLK